MEAAKARQLASKLNPGLILRSRIVGVMDCDGDSQFIKVQFAKNRHIAISALGAVEIVEKSNEYSTITLLRGGLTAFYYRDLKTKLSCAPAKTTAEGIRYIEPTSAVVKNVREMLGEYANEVKLNPQSYYRNGPIGKLYCGLA